MHESGMDVKPYPKLRISKDKSYIDDVMGPTAWYQPENKTITLITEGRHPKDILRSFFHEMIHHCQNNRGDMKKENVKSLNDKNYTQNNKHLRKLEGEAYLKGNMLMRDWTDTRKK